MNKTVSDFIKNNNFKDNGTIYFFTNGKNNIQYQEGTNYITINNNKYSLIELEKFGNELLKENKFLDY